MPKMKTHKGTAKRVHLTGTGKAMTRSYAGGAPELVYEGRATDQGSEDQGG